MLQIKGNLFLFSSNLSRSQLDIETTESSFSLFQNNFIFSVTLAVIEKKTKTNFTEWPIKLPYTCWTETPFRPTALTYTGVQTVKRCTKFVISGLFSPPSLLSVSSLSHLAYCINNDASRYGKRYSLPYYGKEYLLPYGKEYLSPYRDASLFKQEARWEREDLPTI